jgi:hypothetical protein
MELNSTGQVSSLVPEATRPNAPARPQPEATAAPAPAGGTPENAPSAAVADASAGSGADNDGPRGEPKDAVEGVDITV